MVLLAGLAQPAPEDNLIANAGFEEIDEAAGFPVAWKQLRGTPITVGSEGARTGERYVHFIDDSPEAGISLESKHILCDLDAEYTLTAWTRCATDCKPGLYIQFHDDTGRRIFERHVQPEGPCPDWTQLTVSAQPPPESDTVSCLLYAFIGNVGEFDFDDVALIAQGGNPDKPRRPGPSVDVSRAEGKPTMEIADRLELFVDGALIDALEGATLRLHHPVPREVAMDFDQPWEGPTSFYVTVFQDDDRYRLYYRGSGPENAHEFGCAAESEDGITWTRPTLGLFEWQGSEENNIVWAGAGSHNFTPFRDPNPACKPDEKYKALAGGPLIALASEDGYRWRKMREDPVITKGAFDSQNLAFYDTFRGHYRAYFRDFTEGVRAIKVATSDDFLTWTEPEWIDLGESPREHLYTNATTPYFRAPHILMAFPKRYVPGRKFHADWEEDGQSDGVFMTSRDGLRFDRTFMEAFIRPGLDPANWNERNIGTAFGVVPTSDTEISVYWVENYRHDTCRLRRGTLRTDGFVSVNAGYQRGEMLTRPLVFSGQELVINYSTSAVGSLRFELQTEAGEAIEGFTMADCPVIFGDEIERVVSWDAGSDVSALAGRPVRLRVRLKDADLYSIRFRQ